MVPWLSFKGIETESNTLLVLYILINPCKWILLTFQHKASISGYLTEPSTTWFKSCSMFKIDWSN